MCASNISADQDQTDLRVSTWLPSGSRVCNVGLVWTTNILLINYFIIALPIPVALSSIATIARCAPEPVTAHHSQVRTRASSLPRHTLRNKRIYNCSGTSWTGILLAVHPILCIWTDCCRLIGEFKITQHCAALPKSCCMLVKICPRWPGWEWFLLRIRCHMTLSYRRSNAATGQLRSCSPDAARA